MRKYGFYTEIFDDDLSIETLMTGDGKAQFTDINYSDGTAAVGMSYGIGEGVGTQVSHNKELDNSLQIKWQVKFENQRSVDAMIKALLEVKNHLSISESEK